ncbi:hypothetical protein SHIRM173S_06308 [Streptomyces hirsutus]
MGRAGQSTLLETPRARSTNTKTLRTVIPNRRYNTLAERDDVLSIELMLGGAKCRDVAVRVRTRG